VRPDSSVVETAEANRHDVPDEANHPGFRKEITVCEYERGLLYRDGRLERVLEPGLYQFWARERVEVAKVSLREMSRVVAGQEILTADRVEVRLSLVAQYRVTDPPSPCTRWRTTPNSFTRSCNWSCATSSPAVPSISCWRPGANSGRNCCAWPPSRPGATAWS